MGYLVFRVGPGIVWKQVQAVCWGLALIIILGGFSQLIRTCAWRQALRCDIKSHDLSFDLQQRVATHNGKNSLPHLILSDDFRAPGSLLVHLSSGERAKQECFSVNL